MSDLILGTPVMKWAQRLVERAQTLFVKTARGEGAEGAGDGAGIDGTTTRMTSPGAIPRAGTGHTPDKDDDDDFREYESHCKLVTTYLEAPAGPAALREWLLVPDRGIAGHIRTGRVVPETGEYVFNSNTLGYWLDEMMAQWEGVRFRVDRATWTCFLSKEVAPNEWRSYAKGDEKPLPAWAVRFHHAVSHLWLSREKRPHPIPLTMGLVALSIATIATADLAVGACFDVLTPDVFSVPPDRLALIEFAVMLDGTMHALYPNQNTIYTVCDIYLQRDDVLMRGRCRTLSAFLTLSDSAEEQWSGHLSVCSVCKARVRQQMADGAQAERTFMEMSQLEDARLPVDVDAAGLLRSSSQ